mgnify:CR=1 FL=1
MKFFIGLNGRGICRLIVLFIAVLVGGWFSQAQLMYEVRNTTLVRFSTKFSFTDSAKGGVLYIVNNGEKLQKEVSLDTVPGESPEAMGARIKEVLYTDSVENIMPTQGGEKRILDADYEELVTRIGATILYGDQGAIILGGTETGLGIQPPAGSLSAYLDKDAQAYVFRWHEKADYDDIRLRRVGGQYDLSGRARHYRMVTGQPFDYTVRSEAHHERYRYVPLYVVGFQNGLPTNASYILLGPNEQVDCFFHPFTNGMTTNWTGWSLDEPIATHFEERPYTDTWAAPTLDSGRTYPYRSAQIIQSNAPGTVGGMYRSFIAQTPGHAYRPSIRWRVMEEVADFAGEWAADVMVGTIDFDRSYELDEATRIRQEDSWKLLEESGSQIRKWYVDHNTNNTGEWIVSETGAGDSNTTQNDILLGEDKTAIFICVRLTGMKPNGVAIDSVRLLDVTEN